MRHIQAGAHSAEVEGDLVLLRLVGDLNEAEAVQIMAAAAAVQDIYGYHLGLSDLRSSGRLLPEARRYIGEWTKRHSLGVNASFGGSVVAFAIATLIHRAASMIRGQESKFGFFKTEAEARAWLDAQRPPRTGPGSLTQGDHQEPVEARLRARQVLRAGRHDPPTDLAHRRATFCLVARAGRR